MENNHIPIFLDRYLVYGFLPHGLSEFHFKEMRQISQEFTGSKCTCKKIYSTTCYPKGAAMFWWTHWVLQTFSIELFLVCSIFCTHQWRRYFTTLYPLLRTRWGFNLIILHKHHTIVQSKLVLNCQYVFYWSYTHKWMVSRRRLRWFDSLVHSAYL